MIRDHLVPAVKEVFPNLAFKISPTSNPIISLSSSSAEIGDLHIYDDGDQATVIITGIVLVQRECRFSRGWLNYNSGFGFWVCHLGWRNEGSAPKPPKFFALGQVEMGSTRGTREISRKARNGPWPPGTVDFSTRESGPLGLRFRRALSCQDSAESLRRSVGAVERQA